MREGTKLKGWYDVISMVSNSLIEKQSNDTTTSFITTGELLPSGVT